MDTTNFSTSVGTVTYRGFPTYDALNRLRTDVVKSVLIFLRLIGLSNSTEINIALGNPAEDNRATWILSRSGLTRNISEDQAAENRKTIEEIQKSTLGNDENPYTVLITEIATLLEKSDYLNNCQKALEALLKEKQNARINPKPAEELAAKAKADDVERQVMTLSKKCFLSPTVTFQQAKQTEGYFKHLMANFPNVPSELIAAYLFFGKVTKFSVNVALRDAGVARSRGFRVKDETLIERAAFVAWTGGDWRKYYESGGEIEIVPPIEDQKPGRPALKDTPKPKKAKAPKTPKPPKPPKTSKAPKAEQPKPVKPAKLDDSPNSQAIITITGSYQKIKDMIFALENDPTVKLIEYAVKK
jgi:hypothetical protein